MSIAQVLYRAEAKATGGRDGRVVVPESGLDVKLTTPKGLGGAGGEGSNPEQLFAAGYAACFLSALKMVATQAKVALPGEASITGTVGIGPAAVGFGLEVELQVSLPGVDRAQAETLVATAHKVCPYSNATRGNVDVKLTIV